MIGDLDALLIAGRLFHTENTNYGHPLNQPKMVAVATALINHHEAFTFAAFDGDEIVGFLAGEVVPDLWTDTTIASEHAFYVLPEYRSQGVGTRIISRFLQWAEDQGAASVRLMISGGINDEYAADMLSQFGLHVRGFYLGKGFN